VNTLTIASLTPAVCDSSTGRRATIGTLDLQRFILRDNKGENLAEVFFDEEQYDDALLAFEADKPVSVQIELQRGAAATLKSLEFLGGAAGLVPDPNENDD
jgi:hypothetical protein